MRHEEEFKEQRETAMEIVNGLAAHCELIKMVYPDIPGPGASTMDKLDAVRNASGEHVVTERNEARQVMYELAEHCKGVHRDHPEVPFPKELVEKVNLSIGIGGYKFPVHELGLYFKSETDTAQRRVVQDRFYGMEER